MPIEHNPTTEETPSIGERFVGERECKEITDLSRVTRWRLMRRGEFPAKVRLSPNRTAWKLSSVLAWLDAREAA